MRKRTYFISVCCIAIILFVSCKKSNEDSTKDLYKDSPSTSIPAQLKGGLWFWGSLSPVSYYDRDGHQLGNDWEAAREYSFKEVNGQGRLEFIQYLGTRSASNCVMEVYTYKKGTVAFKGVDKFIFYPVEGNFKTVKKGCSGDGTTTRKATAGDLKAETWLWEVKSPSGEPLMYIYDSTDVNKADPVFVYSYSL